MPTSNVTGISSGIDWNEMVSLMMKLERAPVDKLETRRSAFQTQLTDWGAIESKLTALKSSSENMDTINEFLLRAGSSGDEDVLTVTARANAHTGSHSVLVNQIATRHVQVHTAGWADLNSTPVNDSGVDQSLSYEYAGEAFTIIVPDGTTLQSLINLINRDTDNPGVTASVINDGQGGATPYHLMLSGDDTGEENLIQIIDTEDNPTDLGDGSQFDNAAWTVTQTAQNAEIRVDGFPDPEIGWPIPWIESASNDVEDIIPGVTLHLKNTSAGEAIQVSVSLDKAAVETQVNSLINTYNDLLNTISAVSSYNTESETAGPLFGDSQIKAIKGRLSTIISNNIPGTQAGDTYRTLGQVGIKLTSGGKLSLNTKTLQDALDDDAMGVARLFAFDSSSSSGFVTVTSHSSKTQGGTYDFTVTYDADGHLDPEGVNTLNGQNATVHGESLLEGAAGDATEGLLMILTNPGNGPSSLSGTINVYTGFGVLLSNAITDLTDTTEGGLKMTRDRINSSIKMLDNRIERLEDRLTTIEDNYKRRFSNMEILLGQLQTQGSYLDSIG
ncbi:MAG: flagellar filament capping protein FliD [Calditrichota bacterium]